MLISNKYLAKKMVRLNLNINTNIITSDFLTFNKESNVKPKSMGDMAESLIAYACQPQDLYSSSKANVSKVYGGAWPLLYQLKIVSFELKQSEKIMMEYCQFVSWLGYQRKKK